MLALGMLLSLPYWLYQILRYDKYRRGFLERVGKVPTRLMPVAGSQAARQPDRGVDIPPAVAMAARASMGPQRVIWVHAVSLGEVLAISRLVLEMRRTFPQHRILVSTTTDTGQQLARKRFGEENVFYFPMDFSFAIRPYLQVLRPELVVLAET